jgi:thiosulfate/3-mercaptopyruvate sulfurtransferase
MKRILASIIAMFMVVSITGCSKKVENIEMDKVTQEEETYVDSSYIAECDWLNGNMDKENILILDARSEKEYKKGHIPGAINVAWQSFASMEGNPGDEGWGVALDAQNISEAFSNIGVDENKIIIAYSDAKNGWGEDGRFVWMMRMYGIDNSQILNGGFELWEEKGYETTSEETVPEPSNFTVEDINIDYTVDTEWVKNNIETAKILDSRTETEYNGATKYGEARGGHLPNAIYVPYTSLFNEDCTIKSQSELEAIFSQAGINKDDEIASYCTAGIRSAYLTIALRIAGYEKAKNYDESFYTWAADESLDME